MYAICRVLLQCAGTRDQYQGQVGPRAGAREFVCRSRTNTYRLPYVVSHTKAAIPYAALATDAQHSLVQAVRMRPITHLRQQHAPAHGSAECQTQHGLHHTVSLAAERQLRPVLAAEFAPSAAAHTRWMLCLRSPGPSSS